MERRNIPEKSLVWPCPDEKATIVGIKVGEISVYLQDPIRLDESDAANIYQVASASKEWLRLYPRNDVVE